MSIGVQALSSEQILIGLTGIFVLGIGAQWIAWRIRVPSILLLLATGFLVGPVAGWLRPDEMFGNMLFPIVSLSVAVVLFEGSLGLRFSDLHGAGWPLWSLLTVGVLITWAVCTMAAYWVLGFRFEKSLLLGAMLVVTGPTVVGPMLRHIRPTGRVSPIARWEGIIVDPIGAVLAVLVFEVIHFAELREAAGEVFRMLAITMMVGGTIGAASAWGFAFFLKRHWIPDHLQSPVALMFIIGSFLLSNLLQHESGLLTVTVMGVILANEKTLNIKSILEFKENLTVLLISSLFILLSARVDLESFLNLGWSGLAFVLIVILVSRPAAVFLSMAATDLTWKEKTFLSWLAPRGIVAAAVASVFALRMGVVDGAGLVPATFLVIVGTVVVYGLTAFPLACKLGLASSDPQGVLIASAHAGARAIAHAIQTAGFRVVLIDTNHDHIRDARMEGLTTHYGNVLSDQTLEDLDLGGIGRFLALTPNDEVNALAAMHFSEVFGRANVYQLPPVRRAQRQEIAQHHLRGRFAFQENATYSDLDDRFAAGAVVKMTHLTQEFTYPKFLERYGEAALLLFVITETNRLVLVTADRTSDPKPGQKVIALVPAQPPGE